MASQYVINQYIYIRSSIDILSAAYYTKASLSKLRGVDALFNYQEVTIPRGWFNSAKTGARPSTADNAERGIVMSDPKSPCSPSAQFKQTHLHCPPNVKSSSTNDARAQPSLQIRNSLSRSMPSMASPIKSKTT